MPNINGDMYIAEQLLISKLLDKSVPIWKSISPPIFKIGGGIETVWV